MQIHEIFRKRPTNEGVLKGVPVLKQKAANFAQQAKQSAGKFAQQAAPIAGAVASNLGGQILQKAGLPSSAGLKSDEAGFGSGMDAAAKVNEPLVKQIAARLKERWDLGVTQAMQKAGVDSPEKLDPAAKNNIITAFSNYLHRTVLQNKLGVSYKTLPTSIDPAHRMEANVIVATLDELIGNIKQFKTMPTAQDWDNIANTAYKAMSLMQFYPSKETQANQLYNAASIDKLLKQYAKLINNPTANSQEKVNQIVQQLHKLGPNGSNIMSQEQLKKLQRYDMAFNQGQPIMFGGIPLDPNDPAGMEMLNRLHKQGNI